MWKSLPEELEMWEGVGSVVVFSTCASISNSEALLETCPTPTPPPHHYVLIDRCLCKSKASVFIWSISRILHIKIWSILSYVSVFRINSIKLRLGGSRNFVKQLFPPIEKIIIKKKHMKSLNVNSRGQDKNNYDRERALEEVRV